MLSRKVCRKCRQERWGDYDRLAKAPDWGLPEVWRCPHSYSMLIDSLRYVKDGDVPPDKCPYKLEHGVTEALHGSV
jgi:hypothetical protein